MVKTQCFQDLFDKTKSTEALNLPVCKNNYLKIDFPLDAKPVKDWKSPPLPFAESEVFYANIFESRRLTAVDESYKDVYEVSFDVTDCNIRFQPGDTIGIIPENCDHEVEKILKHLNLESHANLVYEVTVDKNIKGSKKPAHIPEKSTLEHVLKHCLDLRSIVKKLFLIALARYTKEENERRVLEYICSKEGSATYTSHILNKNVCVLDIFSIFPSCKPPIEVLLANLPRLLPRPYSIANSGLRNPNVIKICFSVMDLENNRRGLTTGWLEKVINSKTTLENSFHNLSITSNGEQKSDLKVPLFLRKNVSGFSFPKDLEPPLILLGPGTGVAPFIGFLEEREMLKTKDDTLNLGEAWLFFGCRNPKLDFIYEKELNHFVKSGTLNNLVVAFSRVDCAPKYVQDALKENGEEVAKLILRGAFVFICGDLKNMVSEIKDILVQCLVKYDGQSKDDAERYITNMQKEKRYVVDAWS